jgi:hypothetical protein
LKDVEKYKKIKEMIKESPESRKTQNLAAWTLDKYKQLHILEKLYTEYPDKDWYLIMDADTYLVWPNFLLWLKTLGDSSQKLYLGSPAGGISDLKFAHGGSGILMSHATIYDFAVTYNGTATKWDRAMHNHCCGDLVIGLVFRKRGIMLKPSWPTTSGESPVTLPFGKDLWCEPVVTMHHVDSHEMSQIMNFENSRIDTHVSTTCKEILFSI